MPRGGETIGVADGFAEGLSRFSDYPARTGHHSAGSSE